jgi:hypothetical protein
MTYGCVVHALIDAKLRAAYAVIVLATYLVMIRGVIAPIPRSRHPCYREVGILTSLQRKILIKNFDSSNGGFVEKLKFTPSDQFSKTLYLE